MSATPAVALLLASELGDFPERVDSLLDRIRLLDWMYEAEDKNRQLTSELAAARKQLADARTRLERCPLHRLKCWLGRVSA
jgi:hypothetical protein